MTLTHEQIDAMEAGREIDALVAELVGGWMPIPEGLDPTIHNPYYKWLKPDGHKRPHIDFSTEISAAWEVVEKFDRTHWDISIESDTEDDGKLWGVAFTKWSDKPVGPIVMGGAGHKDLPLAICRAALKAMIERNND